MSGGSFNYICFNLEAERIFLKIHDLEDMLESIKDDKELEDVANELSLYLQYLYRQKLQIDGNAKRFEDLVQAIEWWKSGDRRKENVLFEWDKIKKSDHFEKSDK